jgi:hypothetical protein
LNDCRHTTLGLVACLRATDLASAEKLMNDNGAVIGAQLSEDGGAGLPQRCRRVGILLDQKVEQAKLAFQELRRRTR